MKRSDFDEGLNTLLEAYREAPEELDGKDPSADRFVRDLLQTWREVSMDDFQFADALVELALADERSVSTYKETVDDLAQAIRQHDSRKVVTLAGKLSGILTNYLKKVLELLNRGAQTKTPTDHQNQRRTVELLLARFEQADLSQQLRQATQLAKTAVEEAQKAATEAQNAAGVAAGANLTERFEALGKRHFLAATLFRLLTAVSVLGASGLLSRPGTQTLRRPKQFSACHCLPVC